MNQLQNESSPYLRQHANNPVDWHPWNAETLAKAKREDKPILVSIGYSTCHWCHVMERESFMDKDVADYMNAHFINIKIDREERPDLDALYMDACQIIANESGWPLNVFLTPDLKPFFAGTYFPPQAGQKRMSWFRALQYAIYNYRENREAVERQADRVLARMKKADSDIDVPLELNPNTAGLFTKKYLQKIYAGLRQKMDAESGGFGSGQKFPNIIALDFLLNYYCSSKEEGALQHLRFTINKILRGGIYDQIGGGISRYTVDRNWRIPHFEKMLYDNALFAQLLAKAYQLTGRRKYKTAFENMLQFMEREMQCPGGGFCAALDADSEGGEGAYYIWDKKEIENILGGEADMFCDFFGVSEKGNWEGKNILYQPQDLFEFADKNNYGREELRIKFAEAKQKLSMARQHRTLPRRDEKIILNWNALMVSAYAQIYAATGEEKYLQSAEKLLAFLQNNFIEKDGVSLFRTYSKGVAKHQATLKDYTFLVRALLDVFQLNFEIGLLKKAEELTDYIFENYKEKDALLFNLAQANKEDMVLGQKDLRDEEMPSGNAVMLRNLQDLGILLDREGYRQHAIKMLLAIKEKTANSPLAYAAWANAFLAETDGILEIAIVGKKAAEWATKLQKIYVPFKVLIAANEGSNQLPLLKGKPAGGKTLLYICKNYACQNPLESVEEFKGSYSTFTKL